MVKRSELVRVKSRFDMYTVDLDGARPPLPVVEGRWVAEEEEDFVVGVLDGGGTEA